MSHPVRRLAIGGLAKAVGVSAPAIRHYQEIGLMPAPCRTAGGQRIHSQTDLEQLTPRQAVPRFRFRH